MYKLPYWYHRTTISLGASERFYCIITIAKFKSGLKRLKVSFKWMFSAVVGSDKRQF